MNHPAIEFVETNAASDAEAVTALLLAYNDLHTPRARREPFRIVARDGNGAIQGGALGWSTHRWCYVDIFVLAPEFRGGGMGRKLMDQVEHLARARKCIGIHLNTATFQAPDFYQQIGFTECGRIPDLPEGHTNLWFMKRL